MASAQTRFAVAESESLSLRLLHVARLHGPSAYAERGTVETVRQSAPGVGIRLWRSVHCASRSSSQRRRTLRSRNRRGERREQLSRDALSCPAGYRQVADEPAGLGGTCLDPAEFLLAAVRTTHVGVGFGILRRRLRCGSMSSALCRYVCGKWLRMVGLGCFAAWRR